MSAFFRVGFACPFAVLCILVETNICISQTGSESVTDQASIESSELIEACLVTMEAIDKGDLLAKEVIRYDTVNLVRPNEVAEAYIETIFHRFVFDRTAQRYLYVRNLVRKTEHIPLDDAGVVIPPTTYFETRGIVINQQGIFVREFPGQAVKLRNGLTPDEVFWEHRVLDFRVAGFANMRNSPLYQNRNAYYSQVISSVSSVSKIVRNASNTEILLEFPMAGRGTSDIRQTTRFVIDPNRFVLKELAKDAMNHDSLVPTRHRIARDTIEWTELDGNPVPDKVVKRSPMSKKVGDRKVAVMIETEYDFHWFSVNQEIESARFDEEVLTGNINELVRLADPKLTGALTLIAK